MSMNCSDPDLLACTIKTPKWQCDGLTTLAKCVKVYDGDTATFAFRPHALLQPFTFSCRFKGYNSAEIKGKTEAEKLKAKQSRDFLASYIKDKIVKLVIYENDKYGRPIVDVYINNIYINDLMVRNGHGVPYDGTGPKLF